MLDRVRITDVSPRDGLQNEPGVIPAADKARLVDQLDAAGVDEVEVTSFVSPKWVPQLGDGATVFGLLSKAAHIKRPMHSALVPNERGMEQAEQIARDYHRLRKVSVFTAASETFSRKNTNASIGETLERFKPVIARAKAFPGGPLLIRGYISCVIACPFEGTIAPDAVADVAHRLIELGVDEIDLGDTIGAGTPETVAEMLTSVRKRVGAKWWNAERMTLHLHDTFGHAAACVKTALDLDLRSFDGSVAGLGGCPYASTPGNRAPGNISTELLVRTIHAAGFHTGVDLAKLAAAADFAREIVARSRTGATS